MAKSINVPSIIVHVVFFVLLFLDVLSILKSLKMFVIENWLPMPYAMYADRLIFASPLLLITFTFVLLLIEKIMMENQIERLEKQLKERSKSRSEKQQDLIQVSVY